MFSFPFRRWRKVHETNLLAPSASPTKPRAPQDDFRTTDKTDSAHIDQLIGSPRSSSRSSPATSPSKPWRVTSEARSRLCHMTAEVASDLAMVNSRMGSAHVGNLGPDGGGRTGWEPSGDTSLWSPPAGPAPDHRDITVRSPLSVSSRLGGFGGVTDWM
jgi:hypothetical protein